VPAGSESTPAPPPSAAEEPAAPPAAVGGKTDDVLQSVVITADRRETNLQNTPIAISAFGPETLQDRAVGSIRDLAGQVPNLTIPRASISYSTQTYSLRGIGEADPIQEPVLALYVDDVYQPRQIGSMLDFNDIERIEVLRGPQGTLYGRNSSAGALRIITRDPNNEFHSDDSVSYGSFNTLRALGSLSGPIVTDHLYAGLSLLHTRRDGTAFDPTLNRDVNRIDLDALRGKLRWTPNARWDIQATLNGMIDRSDSRSYIPLRQPGAFSTRTSYSEVQPYQHLNQLGGSLRVKNQVDRHLELKSISSLGGFDLDPVYYDNDGLAALVQKNLIHYSDGYFTQELQANGHYKVINFASGLFYLHERFFVQRDGYSRKNAQATDPSTDPANYAFQRAHNHTDTDSFAAFAEVNFLLTKQLTLTGGLRETVEAKQFVFDNKGLNANAQVVSQSITGDAHKTWSALTPKASISFQWTADVLQYVTYARGFKSGGFDNRATNLMLAERAFNPEYVNSYETGLKSEIFGHRLRANLAAFYNDYKDLQVSYVDPAFPGTSVRGNAGKAHTAGLELETDTRLPGGLSAQFSGGYLTAIYDRYQNAGGMGVNADGHTLINAPRWNWAAGASYELPLPLPGYFKLAADVEWASATYSNALTRPQDRAPAQTFVNGSLSWTSPSGHLIAILSSRNLLDTQKPVTSQFVPNTGVYYFNFPDPRTVLLTLRYVQ
jgi:iron complex outermembrane receptor protein